MNLQIGLYQGTSFLDWLVRIFTRSKYSHVCFISNDNKLEAIAGKGVRFANIMSYDGKWKLDIYDIDISEQKQAEIWVTAYKMIDKGYDYAGVAHFVFRLFKQDPQKYFCSEYFMDVCYRNKVVLCNKAVSESTPNDIAKSKLLSYNKSIYSRR